MIPEYFFSPHLKPLWTETHRRLSAGSSVTTIYLKGLTTDQRHALAELFASARLPNSDTQVRLATLREAVAPSELENVLYQIVGPVGNARREKQNLVERRQALWEWFVSRPLFRQRPQLLTWAEENRTDLMAGQLDSAKSLLTEISRVLSALPGDRTPLPLLAQQCLTDPHGLDEGRLPNFVLKALAFEADQPEPVDSQQRRQVWENAGVIRDDLSSTVLMAGFTPDGETFLAHALRAAAATGEAMNVTLGQIKKGPETYTPSQTLVSVVENPSIMQAALNRFGSRTPPLMCVSGRLHIAARVVIGTLIESGARVRYHGDFDPVGVRIAVDVIDNLGATPWRMHTADYEAALPHGSPVESDGVPPTRWDFGLQQAMRREQLAVYEEAVVEDLLMDLSTGQSHDRRI